MKHTIQLSDFKDFVVTHELATEAGGGEKKTLKMIVRGLIYETPIVLYIVEHFVDVVCVKTFLPTSDILLAIQRYNKI